jgi:hypothetical protein
VTPSRCRRSASTRGQACQSSRRASPNHGLPRQLLRLAPHPPPTMQVTMRMSTGVSSSILLGQKMLTMCSCPRYSRSSTRRIQGRKEGPQGGCQSGEANPARREEVEQGTFRSRVQAAAPDTRGPAFAPYARVMMMYMCMLYYTVRSVCGLSTVKGVVKYRTCSCRRRVHRAASSIGLVSARS